MTWDKCSCKGSGYVSDGSGIAFDNMKPCPSDCGMFEATGEYIEMTKWGTFHMKPAKEDHLNYPLRHWDGDTERGGD